MWPRPEISNSASGRRRAGVVGRGEDQLGCERGKRVPAISSTALSCIAP